jgi:RHS repeat-associated protein
MRWYRCAQTVCMLAAGVLVMSRDVSADPVLELYDDLIGSAPSWQTPVQDAYPVHGQSAVGLDGAMRVPPAFPIAFAGNPGAVAGGRLSMGDVRLDIGAYAPTTVDLQLGGWEVAISRTFNFRQHDGSNYHTSDGLMGLNGYLNTFPECVLVEGATDDKDVVCLTLHGVGAAFFKRTDTSSNTFKGINGAAGVVIYAAGSGSEPDTYTYHTQINQEMVFLAGANAGNCAGQFWKLVDVSGDVIAYVGHATTASTAITSGYETGGQISEMYLGDDAERRYDFTYQTLLGTVRLTQVKAEVDDGQNGWDEVARVDYTYYGTGADHGDAGALKTAKTTIPSSQSGEDIERTTYYRYGDPNEVFNAATHPWYSDRLLLVMGPEGVRRYDEAQASAGAHLTATTSALEPYAEYYFEYDSMKRVVEMFAQGQCGCGGCADGTLQLTYGVNTSFSGTSGYDTDWDTRVTVAHDASDKYEIYQFDEAEQLLTTIIADGDPSGGTAPNYWVTDAVRNSIGVVERVHTPANCTYVYSTGAVTHSTSSGLVHYFDAPTTGDLRGFVTTRKHADGYVALPVYDRETTYVSSSTSKVTEGGVDIVRPIVASRRSYVTSRTTPSTDQAEAPLTTVTTTLASGTVLPETSEVEPPTIPTGENGSGTSVSSTTYHDDEGRVTFSETVDGVISYTGWTDNRVTKSIFDADITATGSGEALHGVTIPTGLSNTGTPDPRITTYSYDDQGRRTQTTAPDGTVSEQYLTVLTDGRIAALSFAEVSGSTRYGPVGYRVMNLAGKVEAQGLIVLSGGSSTSALSAYIDETKSDPIQAVSVGTLTRLVVTTYNDTGTRASNTKTFFDMPTSLASAVDGTHYDQTSYSYDSEGHRYRTLAPHGTITRQVHDDLGRVTETWVGTNDSDFPSGGTHNMTKVSSVVFDSGGVGNNLVTKRTGYIQDSDTGKRETTYSHDYRGRLLYAVGPEGPFTLKKYDNLGRAVASAQYSSSTGLSTADPTTTTTNRLSLTEMDYDRQGRTYETTVHKINPSTGASTSGGELVTETWYDDAGRVIKQKGATTSKSEYDRHGRMIRSFVIAGDNDSSYSDCASVSNDDVMSESQTVYDSDDKRIMTVQIDRLHDDFGIGDTSGPLDTNGVSSSITAATTEGRLSITTHYYDSRNRPIATALYGTNSASGNAADFTYSSTVPTRSDTVLVTSRVYNDDGTVQSVTGPKGIVTRHTYDDAGRTTKTIRNYVDGTPGGGTLDDEDQTVTYAFTDGLKTSVTADLPSGETDQTTTYTYGTTRGTSAGDSKIATGHLLQKVTYPDSGSGTDVVTYAYSAQNQQIYERDQAGNVFETSYSTSGRTTDRAVTTLASGFDGAVRRITWSHDDFGRVETITQYDAATSGSVVNQVKNTYDDYGPISKQEQDHNSAVTGGGDDYEIAYTWAKPYGISTVRKTAVTQPGGASYTYLYSGIGGHFDDAMSRVSKVRRGVTTVAEYAYLGSRQVVETSLPEPDVYHRLHNGSGSYDGLDRFGRRLKDVWYKDLATDVAFVEYDYTYDRASNITAIDDGVQGTFDADIDVDDLGRVVSFDEGVLSGGSLTTTNRTSDWELSQTGNWLDYEYDKDADSTLDRDWAGTFSDANELVSVDEDNDSTADRTFTHDAVGGLTDNGTYKFKWDAFGRLVEIQDQSSDPVCKYAYDGLHRLVTRQDDSDLDGDIDVNDDVEHYVWTPQWRLAAVYLNSDTSPTETYLHHASGNMDTMISRERDTTGNGTLDERVYFCHTRRGDTAAVLTSDGKLLEWAKPDVYGEPRLISACDIDEDGDVDLSDLGAINGRIGGAYDVIYDNDLDGDIDSTDASRCSSTFYGASGGRGVLSNQGVRHGYASYLHDPAIPSLCYVRHRWYDTTRGYWLSRDPLGYVDGMNLYQYVSGKPVVAWDPDGRMSQEQDGTTPGAQQPKRPKYTCTDWCRHLYPGQVPGPISDGCVEGCECAERAVSEWDCDSCCITNFQWFPLLKAECKLTCKAWKGTENCTQRTSELDCKACCGENLNGRIMRCDHVLKMDLAQCVSGGGKGLRSDDASVDPTVDSCKLIAHQRFAGCVLGAVRGYLACSASCKKAFAPAAPGGPGPGKVAVFGADGDTR